MRKLKFRVWDAEYGCWLSDFRVAPDGAIVYEGYGALSEDWVVQQDTGIEDQNGNPIYEGDIVVDKQGISYKVIYDSKYARFDLTAFGENKVSGRSYFTQVYEGKLLEVVGNVFGMPATLGV